MGNGVMTLKEFEGQLSATDIIKGWQSQWQSGIKLSETRTVRMLRVTAVLLADNDGSRASGVVKDGVVRPVDWLLRNPAVHTKPEENYIDDWISLANKQLWVSKVNFMLDRKNVEYLFVKDTAANSYTCPTDSTGLTDLIKKRQAEKSIESDLWNESVLLMFPWGNETEPSMQGCSSGDSPCIKMAAKYWESDVEPRFVDGLPIPGNNLFTHELGHFLGLPHNFAGGIHGALFGVSLVGDPTINPLGLTLSEANLSKFNGLTKEDMADRRGDAENKIATWMFSLEGDASVVTDTPINLGMGLPAVMGDPIGSGDREYKLERFKKLQQVEGDDSGFGTPIDGGQPTTETVLLNKAVRLNAMGYWYSDVYGQRFSPEQVKVMESSVDTARSNFVDRTVKVTVTINKTRLDVTEHAFLTPRMVDRRPEEVKFELNKPTTRQVAARLSQIRRGALGPPTPKGNSCGLPARRRPQR